LVSSSFRDVFNDSAQGERELVESGGRESLEDVLVELRAGSSCEEFVELFKKKR